jgi:hypothetical protein
MGRKVILCGQCIALAKDGYKVIEHSRRVKDICALCGKRRYGAECTLETRRKGYDFNT